MGLTGPQSAVISITDLIALPGILPAKEEKKGLARQQHAKRMRVNAIMVPKVSGASERGPDQTDEPPGCILEGYLKPVISISQLTTGGSTH